MPGPDLDTSNFQAFLHPESEAGINLCASVKSKHIYDSVQVHLHKTSFFICPFVIGHATILQLLQKRYSQLALEGS